MAKTLIVFELPAFILLAFIVSYTVKMPKSLSELIMNLTVIIAMSYKTNICVHVCAQESWKKCLSNLDLNFEFIRC